MGRRLLLGVWFAVCLLVAGLLIPSFSLGQTNRVFTGTAVRVVDGDTIDVQIGERLEKVRYIGMDTPEAHRPTTGPKPGAHAATEANRRWRNRCAT